MFDKALNQVDTLEDSQDVKASMFPPSVVELEKFNLQHCMRFMPQDEVSLAFFLKYMLT